MDEKGSILLSDVLNQRIIRELVLSPYSTTELSRKLGVPPVKMWRRVSKLLEARLIEQTELEYIGNLEKKVYRATAMKFLPREFLHFEPKSKSLKEAFKLYAEIQQEFMRDISVSNEIPKSMEPIEYGVYADLKGFCQSVLNPRIQAKIQRLEKQLSECREFEPLPQTVS